MALEIKTLKDAASLNIDWNLAPEDAVTLYLEWGNNNWHAEHAPVRSPNLRLYADYARICLFNSCCCLLWNRCGSWCVCFDNLCPTTDGSYD